MMRRRGATAQVLLLQLLVFVGCCSCLIGSAAANHHPDDSATSEVAEPPFQIRYVLEAFDEIHPHWFINKNNGNNDATNSLQLSTQTARVESGTAALQVDFTQEDARVEDSTNNNSPLLGWILTSRDNPRSSSTSDDADSAATPVHNCHAVDYLSLWIQYSSTSTSTTTTIADGDSQLALEVTLYGECPESEQDNSNNEHCTMVDGQQVVPFASTTTIRSTPLDEWVEIQMEPSSFVATAVTSAPLDLDWRRIRGWSLGLQASRPIANATTTTSTMIHSGTLFVDQLACVGDGTMWGASFFTPGGRNQSIAEGLLKETFYNSDISATETQFAFTSQGELQVDYVVQQVETWGGFVQFDFVFPGYYNFTGATDVAIDVSVIQPSSQPRRAIFRYLLSDASHCTDHEIPGCTKEELEQEQWERHYSFNPILDANDPSRTHRLVIPLQSSEAPGESFWLTGWSGGRGNGALDLAHIKGFTLEFVLDSQLDFGDVARGSVVLSNMQVLKQPQSASAKNCTDLDPDGNCVSPRYEGISVGEPLLNVDEFSPLLTRIEFIGNRCRQVCEIDPACNYALSNGRDCFVANALPPEILKLKTTKTQVRDVTTYWVDDIVKRGEFCEKCTCLESSRTIDCRGANLTIVPKSFSAPWAPKTLDLRDNPVLSILGSRSLSEIAPDLEEVLLPTSMRYASFWAFAELPNLRSVNFEENAALDNVIAGASAPFGHVCCNKGKQLDIFGRDLSFCDMVVKKPGIDAVYEDFIIFEDADFVSEIRPSSDFLAEASDSPEKCAEICDIVDECAFFTYDARLPNAEHSCILFRNSGVGKLEICCEDQHYADRNRTIPGYISGHPAKTRHSVDNAQVILSNQILTLEESNGYEARYSVSLGSSPLFGAVWVEPTLQGGTGLNVTISPALVVLYDANTTVEVVIQVINPTRDVASRSLVVSNIITSCDAAFMPNTQGPGGDDTTVLLTVLTPDDDDSIHWAIVVGIATAAVLLIAVGAGVFLYFKLRASDSVWHVKESELKFDDPPEILGRGTFGLVLLGELRGTRVAVKRVIPRRDSQPKKSIKMFRSSTVAKSFNVSAAFDDIEENVEVKEESRLGFSSWAALDADSRDKIRSSSWSGTNSGGPILPVEEVNGSRSKSTEWDKPARNSMVRNSSSGLGTRSSTDPVKQWQKLKKEFIQEMRYVSKLRHPCITTVMGAVMDSKTEPMLVMELMDHGSLADLLQNDTVPLDGELLLGFMRDIAQGMRFLHSASPPVIHGDMKAGNVLVDSRFHAKVADFGLSQKKHVGGTGTPFWMAPELLRGESQNTAASDVYSFGITLYEVYSRSEPYKGEDPLTVLKEVAHSEKRKRPPVPDACPTWVRSLFTDCLQEDPSQRPEFQEIDTRLKRANADNVEPGVKDSIRMKKTYSLHDIFPKHIADKLATGRAVEPEHHESVTVFFSDIVGYTTLSSTLPAAKVSNLVDRLFDQFDALASLFDVWKLETIGDAYIAATNLVKKQPDDHAKIMAEFSLQVLQAARETLIDEDDPSMGYVNIRIGFHTGPLVADVVGRRNPKWCILGDTVNTASRMESTSVANRIQCSEQSAVLIQEQCRDIVLKSRGPVPIKGKGELNTFWVETKVDPLEEGPLPVDERREQKPPVLG